MSYLRTDSIRDRLSPYPVFPFSVAVYGAVALVVDHGLVGRAIAPLAISDGLAVAFGLLFGLPGALGVAVGVLVTDATQFAVAPQTLVDGLSLFVLAYAGRALWERNPVVQVRTIDLEATGTWIGLAATAAVSSLLAASVLAWGYEILGVAPFYVSVVPVAVSYLVGTALVTPPVVALVQRSSALTRYVRSTGPARPIRTFWGVTLLSLVWAVLGSIGSLGFTIREKFPRVTFTSRDVGVLYEVVHPDVFGHGGRRAQVLFGAGVVAIGYVLLRRERGT